MSDSARATPDTAAPEMPDHPPVSDWVHDFDHTDPRWTEDPFPIWDQLRAVSPVVHTDRFLGCYLPTTYEAVRQIANDTEHFSSRRVIVREMGAWDRMSIRTDWVANPVFETSSW